MRFGAHALRGGARESSKMLAFDLETTGLDPCVDRITCAAAYDPAAGIERVFFFHLGDSPEEFMCLLDQADRLCAFNGGGFDLRFLAHAFDLSVERLTGWRLKLHDVFVACKWGVGVTFPLQALLELNGMEGKTGSGKEAIRLFEGHRWLELGNYCMHDARLTHRVSSLDKILLPKTKGMAMDSTGGFFLC
jgi:hypothetical protein